MSASSGEEKRQVNFASTSTTPEAKQKTIVRQKTPFCGTSGGWPGAETDDKRRPPDLAIQEDEDMWQSRIPRVQIDPSSIPDQPSRTIRRIKTPGPPGLPVWNGSSPRVHIDPDSIPDQPAKPIRRVKTPMPGTWPQSREVGEDENRVHIDPESIPDHPAKTIERQPTPVCKDIFQASAQHADQLTKVWGEAPPDEDLDRLEISHDINVPAIDVEQH